MSTDIEKRIKVAKRDEYGRLEDRSILTDIYDQIARQGKDSLTPTEMAEHDRDRRDRFTSYPGEFGITFPDGTRWPSGQWPEDEEERDRVFDRNKPTTQT